MPTHVRTCHEVILVREMSKCNRKGSFSRSLRAGFTYCTACWTTGCIMLHLRSEGIKSILSFFEHVL